jgi:outer membrane protein assembly factor BamB
LARAARARTKTTDAGLVELIDIRIARLLLITGKADEAAKELAKLSSPNLSAGRRMNCAATSPSRAATRRSAQELRARARRFDQAAPTRPPARTQTYRCRRPTARQAGDLIHAATYPFPCRVVAIAPGCSTVKGWFGGKTTSKVDQPAELVAISSPIGVSKLWSVDLGDGEERRWLRQHPTFANGRVFATDDDGNLLALDAGTGKEVWSGNAVSLERKGSAMKFWKREAIEAGLTGSPGVGEGLVVVGGRNGEVVAFAENGEKKWETKVTSEVLSAPLIQNGRVIVRSNDGRVFGLDTAGQRKWVYDRGLPTLSVRGNASPVGADGVVYVGYDDGTLVALRAEDGGRLWEQLVAEPEGRTELARMADIDGELLRRRAAVRRQLPRQDHGAGHADRPAVWTHDVGGWSGAALTPSAVLLTDKKGNIWALDRSTATRCGSRTCWKTASSPLRW